MDAQSVAKIISYNLYGENICASAAKISTTKGNACEIFEQSRDSGKNRDLIRKVLKSGHNSVIEHAVFTIALWNVSVFVEQFFIEFRLASFTVKSRRYVDFSGLGYYIPSDLDRESREEYRRYMDMLFEAYRALLEDGVPKEDARFVLPYSFHSNFYCTLNARELVNLLRAIRHGRGRGIPELQGIADQLTAQLKDLFPSVPWESEGEVQTPDASGNSEDAREELSLIDGRDAGGVTLVQAPPQPERLLEAACRVSRPGSTRPPELRALLSSDRPRELEQLTYSFEISDLSLAGITHMVRHRMQSVLVPPLERIGRGKHILPETVQNDPAARRRYEEAIARAFEARGRMEQDAALKKYGYYMLLSGNVTNIFTTMNARELALFIRLRSCSRAQWEIRAVAVRMLELLRRDFPALFSHVGPACYMTGACPEGRLSCGEMERVVKAFREGDFPL